MRGRSPARLTWIGSLAALLIAAGLGLFAVVADRHDNTAERAVDPPRSAAPANPVELVEEVEDDAREPAPRRSPRAHPARGAPTSLTLPTLEVVAPVIDVDMTPDNVLTPPDDPRQLGWWAAGAPPGAVSGSALIVGHSVSSGGGAFDELDGLEKGDLLHVRTTRGVVHYATTSVRIYRKDSLARDAQHLFSQSVPGRLVLVTCEDWDGENWLSNAVVIAEPVSTKDASDG